MNKIVRIAFIALVLVLIAAMPAVAENDGPHGHSFHATIDGWETGFSPGPNPGRCPAGTEWMIFTAGSGVADGYGAFEFTTGHCSRVVTLTPSGAVGKLAAGVMVLTFDEENVLELGYKGTWQYDGDLTTGEGIAKVHQSYEVLDGTGMFAGAKGHGHVGGVFDFHRVLMDLDGGLILAK